MVERRQFERLDLSEDALVKDERGQRLGRVTQASGGGMLIALEVPVEQFALGSRMRVTISEPATQAEEHTIDVVVRYRQPGAIGVEFVTGR
jgi:hypothetical protein